MQKTSTASIKSSSVEKDSKAAALNPTTIMRIIIKHSLGYLFSYLVGYSLQSPSFHMNAVLWYFGSSVLFSSLAASTQPKMKSSAKILLIPFWKTGLFIKRFAFYPPPTHMNPNYEPW